MKRTLLLAQWLAGSLALGILLLLFLVCVTPIYASYHVAVLWWHMWSEFAAIVRGS